MATSPNQLIEALRHHSDPQVREAAKLIEKLQTEAASGEAAKRRIATALAHMDKSQYGDSEVPFRMQAILIGDEETRGYDAEGRLFSSANEPPAPPAKWEPADPSYNGLRGIVSRSGW
jgi:hypothetical protein